VKFCTTKIFTVIWFFALFLNVFSITLFAVSPNTSAEMVYCPLTKKLQPVKAPKKEFSQNPLEEVCAPEKNKKSFVDEVFGKNLLRVNLLDKKQFENLVFDFFQKGESAFANLPQFPDLPHKYSVKAFSTVIGFGKNDETRFVWKEQTENFNFAQHPRPPDFAPKGDFSVQIARELKNISRNINPRSPPFFI